MSHLREQGIERLDEVRMAFMEGDGKISVLTRKKKEKQPAPSHDPS